MNINRREFLLLSGALACGCESATKVPSGSGSQHSRVVNAGSAGRYSADGLYSDFRDQGFFLVRKEGKLFALSSYCTHRRCKLTGEADRTFYCPCHGSAFDQTGKVTEGPAFKPLPVLETRTDEAGHLLVSVPAV